MKNVFFCIALLLLTTLSAMAQYQYKGQTDKKGLPHGQGVMTWSDGSSFEGTFSKGNPVKGTFIAYKNGKRVSKGTGFYMTKKHPKGQLLSSDILENGYVEKAILGPKGLLYKGEYRYGVAEGKGECFFFEKGGYIYSGSWENNYPTTTLCVKANGMHRGVKDPDTHKWLTRNYRKGHDKEAERLWKKYEPYRIFGELCNYEYLLDDLKNTGTAMIVPLNNPSNLEIQGDVRWSGDVRNGKIQGSGIGFVSVSGNYLFIRGMFNDGFPQGKVNFDYPNKKFTVVIGDAHNGFSNFMVDNKYGFINELNNSIIPATYKKVLQPFNSSGYAEVVNDKDEEIKIDRSGMFIDYTDNQKWIFEEERKLVEREAARVAEEKRQAERKAAEEEKYKLLENYYKSFNFASFTNTYIEYKKEYSSFNASHQIELEKMNSTIPGLESRIAAGKDIRKWHVGSQICLIRSNGIMHAVVEKINGDQTFAEVKVLASPSGEYNGQEVKKNRTIWIQKNTGWHLALDEEVSYAKSYNSVRDPDEKCSCCTGKGYNMCTICSGTGRVYYSRGGYDKDCDYCKGSGHRICGCCNGTGR